MDSQIKILIIYTGGTIGMIKDNLTGSLTPFDFKGIYDQIPELNKFKYHLDFYSFDPLIDSSNIYPSHWVELATLIEKNYENYDGFVILHGTDTMSYTGSALSFLLENLNKPVILTGSQLPLGELRTDGRENFLTAIEIAAATEDNTPLIPEVCIYFENALMRANRTIKYNAENFNAFISPNYPLLAEAGVYIKYNKNNILKPNFKKLKVYKNLVNNIGILKLFPGISYEYIHYVLNIPKQQVLIMETYGAGNAPTDNWFIEELKMAINKGLVIINVTQCLAGAVNQGKYDTSFKLKELGVVSGYDITTEALTAKSMFLLGQNLSQKELKKEMNLSLRGEMTVE